MKYFDIDWLMIIHDYKEMVLDGGFVLDSEPTKHRLILELQKRIELFAKVVHLMKNMDIIKEYEANAYILAIENMLDRIDSRLSKW